MLSFVLGVVSFCTTAFVSMKLWAWLVVPIFGVSALSFAQIVALKSVIYYFFPSSQFAFNETQLADSKPYQKLSDNEKLFAKTCGWLLISAAALLVSWVLTYFI